MRKYFYLCLFCLSLSVKVFSQNTNSQNYFILPQVPSISANCLSTEKGKIVYNTSDNKIYYCNGATYSQINGISSNFYSLSDYSLSTYGKIKFSGLKGGIGKVLTSIDTSGTAEWKSVSGGSSVGFSYVGTPTAAANAQTITGGSTTLVKVFNVQEFDDDNLFKVTTDSCHFRAKENGMYHFDIKMTLVPVGNSASVEGNVYIKKTSTNPGTNIRISNIEAYRYANFNIALNIKLLAGDRIEVWFSSATNFKVYAGANANFSGYKVY